MKFYWFTIFYLGLVASTMAQTHSSFAIRTITAGVALQRADDTATLREAIQFLKKAREQYQSAGYTVQTIRITTQHLFLLRKNETDAEFLQKLMTLDHLAQQENIVLGMGWLLPADTYEVSAIKLATEIIAQTQSISFTLPISQRGVGIYPASIRCSAEIIQAIARTSDGGEGNFRFAALANCPGGIPFFPAGFHQGERSFAIGCETPNIIRDIFSSCSWEDAVPLLTKAMESKLQPVEHIALAVSREYGWPYDGIDTSPAPGLNASIGEGIEALTKEPFGAASTMSACSLITTTIKNLDLRRVGYCGLMLPVIEDPVLAQRASENRYTVQDLLLFSAVSGTGLDVVPLAGETTVDELGRLLQDVASLSLKYENKALSARLFPIPGKAAGEQVSFTNPYLTSVRIMPLH
ncbi:MAG TPA: DUF711 family protein [Saprospiraceae bacterium]|nr:DUF711 family protein [Saprospiraceae bacterium]HPG08336.1 DUF711 family protein [Saprospiraceae bacterium]HPR00489.1 DUF711 family protein [Saprospiraceae bacterium]HRV85591.1 DUF711 family protein [Saprospiraceae bacterium]